jgi:hypothetical protein
MKKRFPAHDQFRKSSYSPILKNCVGVCFAGKSVFVKNTKLVEGSVVQFNKAEWKAFLLGVKAGEFDI